ncbi:MAG: hypothetical protein K2L27_04255 [Muribaculaceae bacterium]|nr:hypothetical protein [Muribaculaceae bacterium]
MRPSESSNSRKSSARTAQAVTWLCRVVVGAAFIAGGWAKCIDPYGTMYKMLEYLAAMGVHAMPHEVVIMAAVSLGALEFGVGVCVLCGVLRHSAAVAASAVMCFMLPLTAYILIADPVADCGCFGDMLVVSNTATFLKNIVLSAACVWLLLRGNNCAGVFGRDLQWVVLLSTLVYALTLAAAGYNVQPLVDFRDYPLGTYMAGSSDGEDMLGLIYRKDGVEKVFQENDIPDSTWTYVGLYGDEPAAEGAFAVFDTAGEEVTVFEPEGDRLVFVVPDPGEHFLTRSRYTNELAGYAATYGVDAAVIVGTSPEGLREWALLAAPDFAAYCADDTDLKTLVRGDIAAVYIRDGRILWKRNLASLDTELLDKATPGHNVLADVDRIDDGRAIRLLSGIYLGLLLVLAAATGVVRFVRRR